MTDRAPNVNEGGRGAAAPAPQPTPTLRLGPDNPPHGGLLRARPTDGKEPARIFDEDRSLFPEHRDGRPDIDLASGRFVKLWQGPQHPGITGNMS